MDEAPPRPRGWRKPRIRTVLLLANLALLALPLGGLWLLRLYESTLVRQTETELIGQAAVIAAAYRAAWAGPGAPPKPLAPGAAEAPWTPRFAMLDLARDPVLPAPPEAPLAPAAAEPRALAAGAALQPVLAEAQRVTLAAMRVLDREGVVVASTGEEMGRSLAGQEEVAAALAGRPASVLRARLVGPEQPRGPGGISRGAAIRVFVAQPVTTGPVAGAGASGEVIGAILLSRTPAGIEQTLRNKRRELAVLALALLGAAGGLAAFTAYTVSRPIQAVAAQARAVAAGARVAPGTGRVRRSAVREADELSAAIRAMAATLERRADYIGAFAAEVSHEFKTPLAGLRGALELLRDHAEAMTPGERERFLSQGLADVERLDRLVRRLLELARAEAPLPRPPGAPGCELGAVVAAAARPFAAAGMRLRLVPPGGAVPVAVPAEAVRAAVANLLENVRQHAGPGATASLSWQAPGHPGGPAVLRVSDDGRGISEANAARVFDRFFTTAREAGGTGLGLPIARSGLEAAGGSIRLARRSPGAAFEVTLPAA